MNEPIEVNEINEIEGVDGCPLKWELARDSKGKWIWKWVRHPPQYPDVKPSFAKSYQAIAKKAMEFGIPLDWALAKRREYLNTIIERKETAVMASIKKLAGSDELHRTLLNRRVADAFKEISNAQFDLKRLQPGWRPQKNGLTDEMIVKARNYHISSLLPHPVNNNKTLCPFHDDHTPSMYVNNNYVYCFVCNKGWNPIDFVMALEGYDFKEAVKYLNEM